MGTLAASPVFNVVWKETHNVPVAAGAQPRGKGLFGELGVVTCY